jgi:hypothetical protein
MKTLKFFSLIAVATMMIFASCKNEAADANADRETLASPNTNTELTTPSVKPKPNATNAAPVGPLTTITFDESTFDFGEVMEGEKVSHDYKFKNTGSEPLVISNAKGSCGCTVPDWPREPIPVGEEAAITVVFDTKGKGNVDGRSQSKRVTITANTDPVNTYLTIKGSVKKEAADS